MMVLMSAVTGVSIRKVDDLVQALGMRGLSKTQVSRFYGEPDERVYAFLERRLEGNWPCLRQAA